MPKPTTDIRPGSRLKIVPWWLCFLLFAQPLFAQYNGLIFASRETAPEKRTMLDLTPQQPLCLTDSFQLNFDISFVPGKERYSGYIFRIIDASNENIDLLFDGRDKLFKVVYKERFTEIQFSADIFARNRFRLRYDNKTGISFWVNDRFVAKSGAVLKDLCLKLFFGANYYHGFRNTDLPAMTISNLALSGGGGVNCFWPLSELEGDVAVDSIGHRTAAVMNPIWVRSRHERWGAVAGFTVRGNPSTAFDPVTERLFVVNNDSLYTYSVRTGLLSAVAVQKPVDKLPDGNQSIYDPRDRILYNFYADQHLVSAYDSGRMVWQPELAISRSLTAYWHVNKFISDSCLYILGGYGYNKYKNLIQRYQLYGQQWDTVKLTGDLFGPRYLAGLGRNGRGDTVWLLGGYGSLSGDQMLSPHYYYDLYVFDVPGKKMRKLFTLKEPEDHFVFSNSLVINPRDNSYYVLTYPKDRFDSKLQLIKGSLTDASYQLLGDEIPYWFNDAGSFSDLFYCPGSQLLLAVTLSRAEDQRMRINVYTIATPVIKEAGGGAFAWWYWVGGLGLLVAGGWIFFRRKPRVVGEQAVPVVPMPVRTTPRPGIFLFGNFTVIDKDGADISHQLTPLLKELLLLILIYTIKYEKGVTLEKLNETLWSNMDEKNAKNNRAVNIGKLKSILEKLGACTLKKESGRWVLVFDAGEVNIDFAEFIRIRSKTGAAGTNELLGLVQRGAFLAQENYEWLDDIKSDVSNTVLEILQRYSATLPVSENAEMLITVANTIFVFDELNETALALKCKSLVSLGRHAIAKQVFEKFAAKYKDIYGEDFKGSFVEITAK